MTMYDDKALTCVTCGANFVFTAGEQRFHASKGFTNEPRRCPACRKARRGGGNDTAPVRPEQAAVRPSGRGEAATADQAENGSAERAPSSTVSQPVREQFTAVCSACGGEAILSFEPIGNRAVLCSTCYDKIRLPA